MRLVTGEDLSLIEEREVGIASSLALRLRLVGFTVQTESYFAGGSQMWRPDFRIWLPASKQYIYLELKLTAWGNIGKQYYYAATLDDIDKLNSDTDPRNQLNGLIALGFSYNPEELGGRLLNGFKRLSKDIAEKYPYKEIGVECVDLQGMDKRSSYAVIGLWFRKSS